MTYEDLIYSCRRLIALHDVYDELWFMRIHNPNNCQAFDKAILSTIKTIKEQCEEELKCD